MTDHEGDAADKRKTSADIYVFDIDPNSDTAGANVLRMVGTNKDVLEIGAGPGSISRPLVQSNNCRVTALEADVNCLPILRQFCVEVHQGDLNGPNWSDVFADHSFDVVVIADVLEHLIDPWNTLKAVGRLLRPSGAVVSSIPNSSHSAMIASLLNEDVDYRDLGLLDRTHVRFFGIKNIQQLFRQAGLKIVDVKFVTKAPEETEFVENWWVTPKATRVALESRPFSQVYQSVIKAINVTSDMETPEFVLLDHPPEKRAASIVALEAETWETEKALLTASHLRDISVIEQQKSEIEAELTAAQRDVARLNNDVQDARRETLSILASTSWRITLPLRRVAHLGRAVRRRALDLAYDTYRALPLPRLLRQRLSGSLAKAMPGLHSTVIGHLHQNSVRTPLRQASLAMLQAGTVRPAFTVVIPVYDRTWELREAIQSVLRQTVKNLELILVTDGSPPETMAVINEFRGDPRVRIFSFPRSSGTAVRGRNKGILEARAPYIAFLDSDDICEPDRLQRSFEILEDGNDVVYGAWRAKLDGSRDAGGLADGQVVVSPQCDLAMLREICVPCQSTVAVRRSSLMEVGLLKPRMRYREDHELWVRLASKGAKFKATNAVLATLRLHAGNNELNFKNDDAEWANLLEREYSIVPPRPQKIAFVVAGLGISGGLAIVLKHAQALIAAGHDVTLLDCSNSRPEGQEWARSGNVPVIAWQDISPLLHTPFDAVYATFWTTLEAVKALPAIRKLYFVQSDERLFYADAGTKELVERTYREPLEYIAVADWIAKFLRDEFGHTAHIVRNGVDLRDFDEVLGLRGSGRRPRVLIEGPISVPFKGVADAYAAIEGLDCDVWLVSSVGQPEPGWRLAKFVSGASIEQMAELYSSCDVMVKLSRIESFCLPALEAMACGCAVVVGEVAGGMEFVENGRNAVVVPTGDITAARQAVAELLANSERRAELVAAGHLTAARWSFEQSSAAMLSLVQQSALGLASSPPLGR